jgi:hypothetical protein
MPLVEPRFQPGISMVSGPGACDRAGMTPDSVVPKQPVQLQVTSVTIGAQRPHDLAQFYARLLGLPISADDPAVPGDTARGGWAQIMPASPGSSPTLNFEYEQPAADPAGHDSSPSGRGRHRSGHRPRRERRGCCAARSDPGVRWTPARSPPRVDSSSRSATISHRRQARQHGPHAGVLQRAAERTAYGTRWRASGLLVERGSRPISGRTAQPPRP